MSVTHEEIMAVLTDLVETVGRERHDNNGKLSGTGIFARFARIETDIATIKSDREREKLVFQARASGALAVIAGVCAFLMWFAGDRVENVQKLVRAPAPAEAGK